ncbi:hypothetical protein QQS21_009901, partial [Conoideocrella luteorostrata]
MSITSGLTAPLWGQQSDRRGRRPAFILATSIFLMSAVVFGFAPALWAVLLVMGLVGFATGVTPVLHTIVAELVPQKQLQPRAFSLVPLMWTIGSMAGPIIGGFMIAAPATHSEAKDKRGILTIFPYVLPNLVVAGPLTMSLIAGVLFLWETLEGKHGDDAGLRAGSAVRRFYFRLLHHKTLDKESKNYSYQSLSGNDAESAQCEANIELNNGTATTSPLVSPSHSLFPKSIFTRQSLWIMLYICFLQSHSKIFDEFLPLYMQSEALPVGGTTPSVLSILITGAGLRMTPQTTATYLAVYGFGAIIIQIFIFPPVAQRLGALKLLRAVSLTYPVLYFLTPYISKLGVGSAQATSLVVLLLCKAFCGICAFPSSKIVLCNSAPSKSVLGRLNA